MCHSNRLPREVFNQLAADMLQFNGDPRPVAGAGESPRAPLSSLEFFHLSTGALPAETCAAFQFHASN